jgi:hypothetical protein
MNPGLVGAIFAGAAAIAFVASSPLLGHGGCLAVVSLPLAFLVAGTLAAWSLRVSLPVRVGVGIILAVGGFGSFLGLVATQAMTGRESAAWLFLFFSVYFVISYLLGSALGWFLVREAGSRALTVGVLGFCAGGVAGGAVAALVVGLHPSGVLYYALPMALPAAGGGAALSWGLEPAEDPKSAPDDVRPAG